MVSAETPSEKVRAPIIYLQFMCVIKSPTVMHGVSHWDLFYWPNFILLPLKWHYKNRTHLPGDHLTQQCVIGFSYK